MIARPIPVIWRGLRGNFGTDSGPVAACTLWLKAAWQWRPSVLTTWRSVSSPVQLFRVATRTFAGGSAAPVLAGDESTGGEAVIFRKDSRGDSFQRQISSLRKQVQDDETEGEEFRFEEPEQTSQFTSTPSMPAREETFVSSSSRITPDEAAPAPAAAQQAPQAGFRPSWQSSDAQTSVIASNAHWNGTLRSEGSLHIHGRADGELHATQDVFVAEGAEVDAQLFAENVVVAGIVRGKIEARGRLEILAQGHVSGDVKSPKLVVHEGARLSGQLKMETGGGPASAPVGTGRSRRSSQ